LTEAGAQLVFIRMRHRYLSILTQS